MNVCCSLLEELDILGVLREIAEDELEFDTADVTSINIKLKYNSLYFKDILLLYDILIASSI